VMLGEGNYGRGSSDDRNRPIGAPWTEQPSHRVGPPAKPSASRWTVGFGLTSDLFSSPRATTNGSNARSMSLFPAECSGLSRGSGSGRSLFCRCRNRWVWGWDVRRRVEACCSDAVDDSRVPVPSCLVSV
jgi:hypothetical protein